MKFKCQVCQKKTKLCCELCLKTFYCKYQHQKEHWSIHKEECQGIYKIGKDELQQQQQKTQYLKQQKQLQLFQQTKNLNIEQNKITVQTNKETPKRKITIQNKKESPKRKTTTKDKLFRKDLAVTKQQRDFLRRNVLMHIIQSHQHQALFQTKSLIEYSIQICERTNFNQRNSFDLILDRLILVKIFNKQKKINFLLEQCAAIIKLFPTIPFQNHYINNFQHQTEDYIKQFGINENIAKKNQTLEFASKSCSLIDVILEYLKKYKAINLIKQYHELKKNIINSIYGANSLQISNHYFNQAIWYKQIGSFNQAYSIFNKSLEVRLNQFKEYQLPCFWCFYNMGLMCRFVPERKDQSVKLLSKCIVLVGQQQSYNSSLEAMILQQLGKIQLQVFQIESCFNYWKNCYNIRKISESNSKQFNRICVFLAMLIKIIKQQVNNKLLKMGQLTLQEQRMLSKYNGIVKIIQQEIGDPNILQFTQQQQLGGVKNDVKNQKNQEFKVGFDINLSQKLFKSLTCKQINSYNAFRIYVDALIKQRKKIKIRSLILQSQFFEGLNSNQRCLFLKQNNDFSN